MNVNIKNLISCSKNSSYIIQISTDYVFDGNKKLYSEKDLPMPLNYYGRTKLEAENIKLQEELVKVKKELKKTKQKINRFLKFRLVRPEMCQKNFAGNMMKRRCSVDGCVNIIRHILSQC